MNIPKEYKEHLQRQGFFLEEKINTGLSGGIYVALQKSLNRKVAVKFFDNTYTEKDQNLRKRFIREPVILAKLQHPNIPYVLTTGFVSAKQNNVPYIVMQFICGDTFEKIIKNRTSIGSVEKFDCIKQILMALRTAHMESVIHRDIKPKNLMIVNSGHCFLIDFSIGVSLSGEAGLTRTTIAGTHLGSVNYMSPEQKKDMATVDARSDLYSLGIVLLEMLTGSTDVTDIRKSLVEQPHWIREMVVKACTAEIEGRYQNADEFLRALMPLTYKNNEEASLSGLAFCSNFKCPQANWSPRGYFRGPNIIKDSTNSYCTSCGSQLKYICSGCGLPFSEEPFCGHCGFKHYEFPLCDKCGSFLESAFIDTDTKTNGCSKCQRAFERNKPTPVLSIEDDVPF